MILKTTRVTDFVRHDKTWFQFGEYANEYLDMGIIGLNSSNNATVVISIMCL